MATVMTPEEVAVEATRIIMTNVQFAVKTGGVQFANAHLVKLWHQSGMLWEEYDAIVKEVLSIAREWIDEAGWSSG